MTDDIKKRFRELLRKKDTDGIESFWLELLESEPGVQTFMELTDQMLKAELREAAVTLLAVLVAQRRDNNDFASALAGLKRLAELNPNDRYLRREMVNCYRKIHEANPRLDNYISKSELADSRPIAEAVLFLENCLAFDLGRSVFDSEQGMGRVVELNLMLDKLVVDYGKDKPVSYHIGVAFKHLQAVKAEHFLSRKQEEPERLRELAREKPLELLRSLLQSFERALKPREIRDYLVEIVQPEEWDGFWGKVLKSAGDDPHIKVQSRPERSFQWVSDETRAGEEQKAKRARAKASAESAVAEPVAPEPEETVPETPVPEATVLVEPEVETSLEPEPMVEPEAGPKPRPRRKPPAKVEPEPVPETLVEIPEPVAPSPEPEPEVVCVPPPEPRPAGPATVEEFIAALRADPTSERWRVLLPQARQRLEQEWPTVYRQAFLGTTDKRIWTLLIKELSTQATTFEGLVQELTTYYRKYPAQFLYLQRNAGKYGLKTEYRPLLSRLLDLLDSDEFKLQWAEIRNWLADANDNLLRECFRNLSAEEAEQMWLRINRMRTFEDFRKDEIRKIMQVTHPQIGVVAPRAEDVIYNTRDGIERKEAELKQLLDVELPKSSDDIGRAREFGDLSENYEYKAAKEKQARLLARVGQIQRDLVLARPIDFEKTDTSVVGVGVIVKVEERPTGDIQEFMILGPWDTDPDKGTISYQAPFAQRLLGKRVGDFVPLNPNLPGTKGHKVLEIRKAF